FSSISRDRLMSERIFSRTAYKEEKQLSASLRERQSFFSRKARKDMSQRTQRGSGRLAPFVISPSPPLRETRFFSRKVHKDMSQRTQRGLGRLALFAISPSRPLRERFNA